MKTFKILILTFLITLITFSVYSQKKIDKVFNDINKNFGGEVVLYQSYIEIIDGKAHKIFEIESEDNDNYYLAAWMDGTELYKFGSEKFVDYDIFVNNNKDDDKIKPNKDWGSVIFMDKDKIIKTIKLKKGTNQIAFVCDVPLVPEVDFIRLSKDKDKIEISDEKYQKFKKEIEDEIAIRKVNPVEYKDTLPTLLKNGIVYNNPSGNYGHKIDVNFRYTTYKRLFFSTGQQYCITTYAADGFSHILEIFSNSHPELYTWSDLSSSGATSVCFTVPYTDYYYIRVRGFWDNTLGSVNLSVNAQYNWQDCPVSGSGYAYEHETPTTYNYFTAYADGDSDPRIWIQDNTSPGKIRAYNDDASFDGDFDWGYDSRVEKDFSVSIKAILVSSVSSSDPYGDCDLYIQCANSTISTYFPNLDEDDAIQSASASSAYNCASWGGGRDDLGRYFWASSSPTSTNLSSPWYVSGNFWQSWDNFFGNTPYIRFTDAPTYTRTGATASNGEVAMWINGSTFTHFSVTKPANDQPHGYDWESKPGGLMRTFHPRDALEGDSYGEIFLYYTRVSSSKKSLSFQESIDLGLTVLPIVTLNNTEEAQIENLKSNIEYNKEIAFVTKFNNLLEKSNTPELIVQSNPYFLIQTDEYAELKSYCEKEGENIWPLLYEKAFDDNELNNRDLSILILNELVSNYAYLMEEVKEEWSNNNYNEEGAYIAPSPIANTQNFVKKLLQLKSGNSVTAINDGLNNSLDIFSVYPNPVVTSTNIKFNVENSTSVSLKVYDIGGKLIEIVFENQLFNSGGQDITWSVNNLKSGLYFFKLEMNNKSYNRRFLIE